MEDFDTALSALTHRYEKRGPVDIRAAFDADSGRFDSLSAQLDDLLIDFSKCALGADDLADLVSLAGKAGLETAARPAMFAGEHNQFH